MTEKDKKVWKLRPHHFCCERFSPWSHVERGKAFDETEQAIRKMLKTDSATMIEVVEGPDILCSVCPFYESGRCRHPEGDEAQVRKWDHILLKGLGIEYGAVMSAQSARDLIQEKMPLEFCRTICRIRVDCDVFSPR